MSGLQVVSSTEHASKYRFIDPELFLAPLELLLDEHSCQRSLCDVVDHLVRNPRHGVEPVLLEEVCSYLAGDLHLHIADEEEDLLPLVRGRCPGRGRIDDVWAFLTREHEADRKVGLGILPELERLAGSRALRDPARFFSDASRFARRWRRHLAWEDSVIVPLARRWLGQDDYAYLGREMARRRGVALPPWL